MGGGGGEGCAGAARAVTLAAPTRHARRAGLAAIDRILAKREGTKGIEGSMRAAAVRGVSSVGQAARGKMILGRLDAGG